jgi:hypothetical protein
MSMLEDKLRLSPVQPMTLASAGKSPDEGASVFAVNRCVAVIPIRPEVILGRGR